MKALLRRNAYMLVIGVVACTPGAVNRVQLTPVPSNETITLADLYSDASADVLKQVPSNASQIVVLMADSVIASLSLYELEDIFWLDMYFYNNTGEDLIISPSDWILLDGARTVFRQLQPHEAGNIYRGRVKNIPPYQPKYTYDVQSSTQGYVSIYGNQAYYQENTQGTVTPQEDPYNALGYSIGASIRSSHNKKYTELADLLYTAGFVEGSQVLSETGARGGVYWLKRKNWSGAVIVRLAPADVEVVFQKP